VTVLEASRRILNTVCQNFCPSKCEKFLKTHGVTIIPGSGGGGEHCVNNVNSHPLEIKVFAWMDWGKQQKPQVKIAH
jgi:hypothetical protein